MRSQNARALILVPKYFSIWGIDAIKIFSELVEGFQSYPENPLRYVSVSGDKKVSTHDKKTFDVFFLTIPFLTMGGGRGIICLFRLFELSGDTVEIN